METTAISLLLGELLRHSGLSDAALLGLMFVVT
jgi:hypothetical protein